MCSICLCGKLNAKTFEGQKNLKGLVRKPLRSTLWKNENLEGFKPRNSNYTFSWKTFYSKRRSIGRYSSTFILCTLLNSSKSPNHPKTSSLLIFDGLDEI